MTCVLIASGAGVLGLLLGSALAGAAGAAWGLGVAELGSGMLQGGVLMAVWRSRAAVSPR
jgi:hypothetical protein